MINKTVFDRKLDRVKEKINELEDKSEEIIQSMDLPFKKGNLQKRLLEKQIIDQNIECIINHNHKKKREREQGRGKNI